MPKHRYAYIDNIKFAACLLVVSGHFFMSMTANQLMPYSTAYRYLLGTVYTFHVPVFFVCSGFLYQKSDRVHSLKTWGQSSARKLLDLGVPYIVFTTVTVLMKHLAADAVTSQAGGLVSTLFFYPTAPYWYLYVLLFLFIFIPNLSSQKQAAILLGITFALKIALALLSTYAQNPANLIFNLTGSKIAYHAVAWLSYIFSRSVWFAFGVFLAFVKEERLKKAGKVLLPLTAAGAAALSILTFSPGGYTSLPLFLVGALFVVAVFFAAVLWQPKKLSALALRFSEYFMPVYVMHTILSAGIRILLLKIGVTNLAVHILGGVLGGIILPCVIYLITKKLTPLMFFFYPTKTIRLMRNKNEQNKNTV